MTIEAGWAEKAAAVDGGRPEDAVRICEAVLGKGPDGAAFYCLAGETPFPGPDFILQKQESAFRPLLELAPGTPKELAEAVEKCLKADPAQRFQSAQEFARAIG